MTKIQPKYKQFNVEKMIKFSDFPKRIKNAERDLRIINAIQKYVNDYMDDTIDDNNSTTIKTFSKNTGELVNEEVVIDPGYWLWEINLVSMQNTLPWSDHWDSMTMFGDYVEIYQVLEAEGDWNTQFFSFNVAGELVAQSDNITNIYRSMAGENENSIWSSSDNDMEME
ncbi:hypothetical protein ELUMI_v1c05030 [Williamsoniiplasma luminosum]|uniref:Uncharacterized protein n=1 Tax=Williamsoniiplasma luminosum TaxID=214888 RepID=A0A2K8NTY4_9MOLU|nr:hypothetical protein [Williamsoniiplasma luminosum]ATZ17227.1 hypothetical protein ELUMI_v1c05030 [Williamsoniiplasma luminosum]